MSNLNGIAQFTNRFAQNIMGYKDDKKVEVERVADKEYDRNRQQQQDKRTQETHNLNQKQGNLSLDIDGIKRDEVVDARTDATDARGYGKTFNQVKYFKQMGDESGAIDAIVEGANSHSGLPYKINVDRDVNGKVASRTDDKGNKYYYQNIIDKETGKIIRTDSVTYDQLYQGYNQLQNGQSLEAEKVAYEKERRKALDENKDKLSLRIGEANIDDAKDASKSQRDHNYGMSKLGVENEFELEKLAIQHGYSLEQLDRQTVNQIAQGVADDDIRSGNTPIVGSGGNDGSVGGIIRSLTGSESGGNSGANRTNNDGRSFGGLLQMGDARLTDYARATGSKPITAMQFKNLSASQQQAANNWHIQDLIKQAKATGAIGKAINGVPVTLGGLVAVAHLGGGNGMRKFVSTNGAYNPQDQLRTSLTDYLAKHASGGVQVQRSGPAIPKLPRGTKGSATKQAGAGSIATAQDYNANIDKGVNTAIKGAKQLGVKSDAATTATFARAGTKLKEMGKAKNEREFLDLYQEAFDLVIGAVPDRASNKMSKADKNALGHKVLLSMVGASSLGNLKDIVYKINPSANSGGSVSAGGLTLPGQQQRAPARQTPQTGKLQGLYARGLPAPKTDPKAQENLNYLGNLNDNMDW